MIAIPVSGYLTSVAGGHEVSFFGLFDLPNLVPRNKALDEAAGQAHYVFAWALGVTLVLHLDAVVWRARFKRRSADADVAALPARARRALTPSVVRPRKTRRACYIEPTARGDEELIMAQGLTARIVGLAGSDPLFARIRQEAEESMRREPELATFLMTTILNHETLESAVAHRVAARLDSRDVSAALIRQTFAEAIARDPSIGDAFRADIMAVADRDPACLRMMEPLLYFKGFQALQAYRLSHWLLKAGRRDFALSLQSLVSAAFGVDINPAARIGKGVFLDHATALVVGETTVIEDNVSILQGVTLGGTGKETGDRHPKIRHGVLIGAGAKILGNIEIGYCARVAAGSVVLSPVPHNKTVAGVPARIVGEAGCAEPARDMNQILAEKAYEA